MNVDDLVTLISSVGFPIVACIGMFYMYNVTLKGFSKSIDTVVEQIKELRDDIKELIADEVKK